MASAVNTEGFRPLSVAVLTVSDTRTPETDRSGTFLRERISKAGHSVYAGEIVPDEPVSIRKLVLGWVEDPHCEVVISTGGTGVSRRDVTPETLLPLFDKVLDGFSTVFHALSLEEIGSSTVQSRVTGGMIGDTLVFCLPGSPGACRMGWDRILLQQLDRRHRPCNFVEILETYWQHKTESDNPTQHC